MNWFSLINFSQLYSICTATIVRYQTVLRSFLAAHGLSMFKRTWHLYYTFMYKQMIKILIISALFLYQLESLQEFHPECLLVFV